MTTEERGLSEGERILAINGKLIDEDYWEGLYGWNMGKAGTRVELTTHVGRIRAVELSGYY